MVLLLCAEQQNKTQPNVNGNRDLISQQWSAEMRMNYDLIVTQKYSTILRNIRIFLDGLLQPQKITFRHSRPPHTISVT